MCLLLATFQKVTEKAIDDSLEAFTFLEKMTRLILKVIKLSFRVLTGYITEGPYYPIGLTDEVRDEARIRLNRFDKLLP